MKAAAITGPGEVVVTERLDPRAHGDLVTVKILVAPLCSEFKKRRSGEVSDEIGHEAAGVVVDAARSTLVRNGDRVVVMPLMGCGRCWLCQSGDYIHCQIGRDTLAESGSVSGLGTIAEYLLKPDWLLVPVPDDIPLHRAVMACCGFGPTFTAHQRMGITGLDTIVVSGCGPVGLGGIVQARSLGATIIAVDAIPYRRDLACDLGALHAFDPEDPALLSTVRAATSGRGCAAGIETSGAPLALRDLGRLVRPRGRIAQVAWVEEVHLSGLVRSGLDVFGCWHWNHRRYTPDMWTAVRKAAETIDRLITHYFPLEEISTAMDIQESGQCGKVMILPFGASALDELL